MADGPGLVPELGVRDLQKSLRFWCDLIGFEIEYARPEERFAYITLGQAHVMLDQIATGRSWETAPLEPPLGRGMNLEIQVPSLDAVLERLAAANWPLFMEPEAQWYRTGADEVGVECAPLPGP